ncbi:MAG: hypothetical protein Q8O67_28645 [Deltaproteobacteria bacterium]|nr:hypothetical protein [Deltaproteobacteria bacterium]
MLFLVVAGGARADVPVGANAGYAFRVSDRTVDDRNHGAAASVVVDSPPLFGGFGLRGEGLAFAWPGGALKADPLAVLGGGAALTYLFDDTAVRALASIGGMGGVVVDGDAVVPVFGGTFGLLLRFPLGEAAAVDARLLLPLLVDERFTLQAAALIGFSVLPDVIVAAALDGRSPFQVLLPGFD